MKTHECAATKKKCSKCGTEKPLESFGSKNGRAHGKSHCKECVNEWHKHHYQKNKDRVLQRCAEYRANNKGKISAYLATWYEANRESALKKISERRSKPEVKVKEAQRSSAYYAERAQEIQARRKLRLASSPELQQRYREYYKRHATENRPLYAAKRAKRRTAQLSATPAWADQEKIARIYKLASRVSEVTGIPHVVDHVIPLQNDQVCGLHVETNLRVISQDSNLRKFNKFG